MINDKVMFADRGTGAADSAWMLLQTYLRRHAAKSSHYYRCAATKLFQHGFPLPAWLTAQYKVNKTQCSITTLCI